MPGLMVYLKQPKALSISVCLICKIFKEIDAPVFIYKATTKLQIKAKLFEGPNLVIA